MIYNLEQCQQIIEENISKLKLDNEPQELYEPISYTLTNAGKRLRPALTLLACNMFNDNITDAIHPALGIEVFHNFTLLHDDVLDNANIRRGKPAVHVKWNRNIAILAGDAMMIIAYDLISKTNKNVFPEIFEVFNNTALEVCDGQQYDMNFETQTRVSIPDYIKMIKLKTSVLVAASLKMGAQIGGASEIQSQQMYDFGINMGLAFQLQDDYLDTFATDSKFGKRIGGDILANKKTFLLLKSLELANKNQRKELEKWIQATSYNEQDKINAVKNVYNELNIQSISMQLVEEYSNKATEILNQIKVDDARKEQLHNLLHRLKIREH